MKRVALAALVLSCHGPVKAKTTMSPLPVAAPPPVAPPVVVAVPEIPDAGAPDPTPALAGPKLETWHVGDFDVVASLPIGTREKRPVVVGIHGSHDRPEAACARWRRTFAGWAFVVCPAGVPYRGGLAWGSPIVMADRIDRALAALRERYAAFVADGPVVYAGFSLGATRGPGVVAARPGLFEPVILAEVGHTRIDATASAASLTKGRASHTIVACATKRCATFSQRLTRAAAKAKMPSLTVALVDGGIGRGHLFDETMARAMGTSFAKLVQRNPRWAGFAAALAAPSDDSDPVEEPPADDEDAEPLN